ncbi:hypothetical protein [Spirosoma koreense]
MKTFVLFRRSALLALLFAVSLSACKKSNSDPAPDLASRVAGTYTYSEFVTGGKSYPASGTNLKGTITVTRQTASTVDMKMNLTLKSTGDVFADDAASSVNVTEASGGNIELTYQGTVIARVNSNKISVDGEDPQSGTFTINATK